MVAGAVAVLLFFAATTGGWAGSALVRDAPTSSSANPLSSTTGSTATTAHGNVSVKAGLPGLSMPANAVLQATYTFHVTHFPSGSGSITFYVPSEQVTVPESGGGKITLFVSPHTFAVQGTSTQGGASTQVQKTLPQAGKLVAGSSAEMSSQLIAITNTVPWGQAPISFTWQWKVLAPGGGSTLAAGASSPASIEPQEYVKIVSSGPSQISPGQSFRVCFGGSTFQGRTLSLHMEVPNPYYAFAWNTTHIPANAASPYCMSVQMPTSFHDLPTPLLVHVWAYATQPGILYVLHTSGVKSS